MAKFIGIDPDVEKSGIAIWDSSRNQFEYIDILSFFDLIKELVIQNVSCSITVVVEAGWLIKKSNWHGNKKQSKSVGEKIAKSVGANHQVGKLFVEYCKNKNIECLQVKPMGKLNKTQFKKITGWDGVTNSEKRDAAMLVFGR